jgi:hypothetical protein
MIYFCRVWQNQLSKLVGVGGYKDLLLVVLFVSYFLIQ